MADEVREAMLQQKIEDLEKTLRIAQGAMKANAENALTALDEGDEDEVRSILKSMTGRD